MSGFGLVLPGDGTVGILFSVSGFGLLVEVYDAAGTLSSVLRFGRSVTNDGAKSISPNRLRLYG